MKTNKQRKKKNQNILISVAFRSWSKVHFCRDRSDVFLRELYFKAVTHFATQMATVTCTKKKCSAFGGFQLWKTGQKRESDSWKWHVDRIRALTCTSANNNKKKNLVHTCTLFELKHATLRVNIKSDPFEGLPKTPSPPECNTVLQPDSGAEFHSQWTGKRSSSTTWASTSFLDAQEKTAPTSSLVAAYWRVEEAVDKPVAGSTFMLGEMITAAKERRNGADKNRAAHNKQWSFYLSHFQLYMKKPSFPPPFKSRQH